MSNNNNTEFRQKAADWIIRESSALRDPQTWKSVWEATVRYYPKSATDLI